MIQLEIYGKPIPWSAPRFSGKMSFNPRADQKRNVQWLIKGQYQNDPIQGYIVLEFKFIHAIPKKITKNNKEKMFCKEILPTDMDITNCQKFYEDCLKGIVITDDRNTIKVTSEKLYGEKPHVKIRVWPWEEYRKIYENNTREN